MKHSSLGSTEAGRRRRATAEERQRWIKAWEDSQQTQAEFAAEHGLSVATLRNWLRRASGPSADADGGPKFVEVDLKRLVGTDPTPHSGQSTSWEFEIRLPCGRVVAVSPQTSTDRLRAVLEMLRC